MNRYVLAVGTTGFFIKMSGRYHGTRGSVTLDLNDPNVVGDLEQVTRRKEEVDARKRIQMQGIDPAYWPVTYDVVPYEDAVILKVMKS